MSRYYNRKNNKKKFTNTKFYKIGSKLLLVLLLFGVVGALASGLDFSWIKNGTEEGSGENTVTNTVKYVDVNFIPSDSWKSDGSSYGAWCWNDSGVPAAAFVLATDEDEDGVFTIKVLNEYSNILFVDLIPGATELGASWSNKREQTNNLLVPVDENNYYHLMYNEWSDSSAPLYTQTQEDKTIYVDVSDVELYQNPVIYYFDKSGVNEPSFVTMGQKGENLYCAVIPAGYTHLIVISYTSEGQIGSWENIATQTADIVIPIDTNCYSFVNNTWSTYTVSDGSDE